jgi:uncharacterized membrane protein
MNKSLIEHKEIFTMDAALLGGEGIYFILRWFHFIFGVIWIGLLYYFNFVHGAFMAEADAATKPGVVQKLLPRALLWFRWAAMGTFLTGWIYLGMKGHSMGPLFFTSNYGIAILTGGLLGTLMFLNVWLIIWPNQKIVIASAAQVAAGGQALPNAQAAAARAMTASRTNTLFSFPMLFFMGAASHLPFRVGSESNIGAYFAAFAVIAGLIELNAIKGKTGPMTTIKGVIHLGIALTLVIYVLLEVLL